MIWFLHLSRVDAENLGGNSLPQTTVVHHSLAVFAITLSTSPKGGEKHQQVVLGTNFLRYRPMKNAHAAPRECLNIVCRQKYNTLGCYAILKYVCSSCK